jgi:short-subunit dehydrogenase
MRLAGARALVTGGSSGIGRAVATLLVHRGCTVTVCGSDRSRLAAAEAELAAVARAPEVSARHRSTHGGPYGPRGRATPGIVCDFADDAAVSALARQLSTGPAPDLVVHSAGIGLRGPARRLDPDDVERVLAVNVRAPMTLTGAMLDAMTERGHGRLVFVGSIAGAVGAAGEAAYAASKAALTAYADSLRAELAGSGVGVTVLVPGVVATDFFTRRGAPYHRARPKPIPAQRVARTLLVGIERDRDVVTVPGWLRVPIAVRGLMPQAFDQMTGRWGR